MKTKGKTKQDGRFEKFGIKKADNKHEKESNHPDNEFIEALDKASKKTWAGLIQKLTRFSSRR